MGIAFGAISLGLAGCSESETEFLVTNTQIIHRSGDRRFDYPEDVLVRVAVENTHSSRQTGTLELMLSHEPGGSAEGETWTKTDEVEVSQAASKQLHYRYRDVFEPSNDIGDYSVDGEIRQDDEPE